MQKASEPVRLTWSPSAQAVYGLLQYTNKKHFYSLADVMFITNSSFMINIHPVTVFGAGPTLFSPYHLMGKGLLAMGFDIGECFYEIPATPEQLEVYVQFVKESVDRGLPVIGWDLFCPEFGLIYGYDHQKQLLHARDAEKVGQIPFSEINNRRFTCIQATAIYASTHVDPLDTLEDSLRRAVAFSLETDRNPSSEYRHGLPGYDAWIEAFKNRGIDIPENAYNLSVTGDGRMFAAQFFSSFSDTVFGRASLDLELTPLASEAARHYRDTADALSELISRFPFPHGGEPNDPNEAEWAIPRLIRARDSEAKGIAVMQQMLDKLLQRKRENPLSLGKWIQN
ncbi:hypothetical protein [Cohnella silvisoli]|uniref:DUF4872 domain-containing protein n=1 Tax=Cohnella silvisoli TaxID=2873699 RepID=A0ABV1KSF7_9BACL|nr:hypothetical protein [Cohnella silvisoli]MCD9022633.1 hypothetical protein [Cohnella silvisoli]